MAYPMGSIEELSLFSYELGEEIMILIYLPATFSPLYKYPLLIAQDGKDYFQFGKIGRAADELLAKKEIEPFIIAGIPYRTVEDRWQKYHPNGHQNEAYIKFLAQELVPFLDAEYPTLQIGMGRAMIGDSLGATVSLLTALEYPHTFGKLILQSPYIDEKTINRIQLSNNLDSLNIYHTVGKKETEVKTTDKTVKDFLTPNRELAKVLHNKSVTYDYYEFDGGHYWKHWQPDVKHALMKMFSNQ